MNVAEVAQDLAERIQAYLQGSRTRSLRQLAERSRVSFSTVRRMAHAEPTSMNNVIAVLSAIDSRETVASTLSKYYPSSFRYVQEMKTPQRYLAPDDDAAVLSGALHNRIFTLASTKGRIAVAEIERMFGVVGREALADLLGKELLHSDGDVVWPREEKHAHGIPETLRNIRMRTEDFSCANLGTDAAFVAMITRRVSRDTLKRIKEESARYLRTVIALTEDEPADGIPMYVSAFMNVLDDTNLGGGR